MSLAAGSGVGAREGEAPLFSRRSSGLVREIGIVAAIGIALASVELPGTFINFNAGLTSFKAVDYYLPLLAAAFIWLVAMLAYRHLVTAMPRAGGEYVYLSRVVSPALGAVMGVGVAVFFIYIIGASAHIFAVYTPFMLAGLGSALNSPSITNAAGHVTSEGAIAAISVGVMLVVAVLSVLSLKRLARVIVGMIVLELLTFGVLAVLLADHSHQDFVRAFARYSQHPGAYAAVISAGSHAGVVFGASLAALVATIPFMVLSYNGVLYSYYVGGELRRPARTYLYASGFSIAVLVLTWVGTWALLRHVAGLHFMQAQANLGAHDPGAYAGITSLPAAAGGLGYGLVLSGDPVSKILIATTLPLAAVGVCIAFVTVTTRLLFALAFDRLLPLSVAKVSERSHIPLVAMAVALAGSVAFTLVLAFVNLNNVVSLESLLFALILLAGGVAATFLAHRRPDLVRHPGAADVARWAGIPRSTWAGGVTVVLALFVIIEIVTHSTYGEFTVQSVITLASVLLAGPVVYLVARYLRRRRSQIDLKLAMSELPPD